MKNRYVLCTKDLIINDNIRFFEGSYYYVQDGCVITNDEDDEYSVMPPNDEEFYRYFAEQSEV